jgi:predicted nucleic acid-binding protein
MERIFLDTNVLLDFILDRKPFSDQAEKVIQLKYTEKRRIYTSVLSIANVIYVLRKSKKNSFDVAKELMEWMEVVDLTKDEFQLTLKSKFKDFEDGLQYYSAFKVKADVIISRDVKDFSASAIPVLTPAQFLHSKEL